MTERKLYLGSVGPYLFDDTDLIDDVDGDFAGETQHSIATNRQILITEEPSEDNHVVRFGDLKQGWSYVSDIKFADYSILLTDYIILVSCLYRNVNISLLTAVGISNKPFEIVRIDSSNNLLTVVPFGAETINGETSQILYAEGDAMHLINNGESWFIT